MFSKSSPEKILKEVEIYLSDINVPNYAAAQALKKGIKAFPENNDLKQKLKEIEANTDTTTPKSSPKTFYGILVIFISIMGFGLLLSYFTGNAGSLSLFLGIFFLTGSLILFNQYKNER